MNEDWKVDRTERGIRFACGALMGLVVGFVAAMGGWIEDWRLVVFMSAGVAVAFGVLAARYGDRFWYRLARLLWCLWP